MSLPGDERNGLPSPAETFPDVWQGEPGAWHGEPDLEEREPGAWGGPRRDEARYAAPERGETVATGGLVYGGGEPKDDPPTSPIGDRAIGDRAARGRTGPGPGPALYSQPGTALPTTAAMLTSHAVVPAATVALVSSLLFFLYDLRSVFLPGTGSLQWIGFCFVTATVAIARHGRGGGRGEAETATVYSVLLGLVTVFVMASSPWEAPDVGIWGPLSNGSILAITWRFATRLTERLSIDLDRSSTEGPRLYGVERLEMERAREQHPDGPVSLYELGHRHLGAPSSSRWAEPSPVDGEKAQRDVARLVFLGLLVFAVGEPFLLAGPPEVGRRALLDMCVFLLASGVVLAAASTVRTSERARAAGVRAAVGPLAGRVTAASLLVLLALLLGLGTPGLRFEGSGRLQPIDARSGQADEAGQGNARKRQGDERFIDDRGQSAGEAGPEVTASGGDPATGARRPGSAPSTPPLASTLTAFLATLGAALRWPLLALLALGLAWAAWRYWPAWSSGRIRGWMGLRYLALRYLGLWCLGLWHRWRAAAARVGARWRAVYRHLLVRLRDLLGRSGSGRSGSGRSRSAQRPRQDPFADLDSLVTLEPRRAVLDAYGRMRRALEALDCPPPPEATPLEILAGWPERARELLPQAERLTRVYLRAAYAPPVSLAHRREQLEGLRRIALDSLCAMRSPFDRLLGEQGERLENAGGRRRSVYRGV